MTRRTAFQTLVALVCGVWTQSQQRVQARQTSATAKAGSVLKLSDITPPANLMVSMDWKSLTVVRGGESVTIDQDELFRALKGDAK
jgi:hypothetical protein